MLAMSPSIVKTGPGRCPGRDIGALRKDLNQKPFELILVSLGALVSAENPRNPGSQCLLPVKFRWLRSAVLDE